ncbi:hypothetical protein WN979_14450 [Streptomyces albidoflavus]|uniref:hypothetical protein n=1 Tax=Streptomyces albidoflavus TaxID=1886 RepID=UPI00324D8FCF
MSSPFPSSQMVRTVLDECLFAACKTLIRDDLSSDPEALHALAALATATAAYKAQTLEVAKYAASQREEGNK